MTTFTCTECDQTYTKWVSKCGCGAYGTIAARSDVENGLRNVVNVGGELSHYEKQRYRSQLLSEVKPETHKRIRTGLTPMDAVLNGGFVPGSVTLLGGNPGIGKSTLILQAIEHIPQTLYIAGEEALSQIAERAKRIRINTTGIRITRETTTKKIIESCAGIKFLVVDSIQTITSETVKQNADSPTQVKRCALELIAYAKHTKTTIIIICHVTKDNKFSGPRALEHFVDTTLYFEGEPEQQPRLLRAHKNRYGATNKFGIFKMTERGLIGE